MEPNIIRSIIFLVAGLLVLLFPNKLLKFQIYVLKKIKIKPSTSKSGNFILGIVFLIISAGLFLFAVYL